jgi:hypothetical protein
MITSEDHFAGFYQSGAAERLVELPGLGSCQYGDLPRPEVELVGTQFSLRDEALAAARTVMHKAAQWQPLGKSGYGRLVHDNLQISFEEPGPKVTIDGYAMATLVKLAEKTLDCADLADQRRTEVMKLCGGLAILTERTQHFEKVHVRPMAEAAKEAPEGVALLTEPSVLTASQVVLWETVMCGSMRGVRVERVDHEFSPDQAMYDMRITSHLDISDIALTPPRRRRRIRVPAWGLPQRTGMVPAEALD